jgi:hypothetical protein
MALGACDRDRRTATYVVEEATPDLVSRWEIQGGTVVAGPRTAFYTNSVWWPVSKVKGSSAKPAAGSAMAPPPGRRPKAKHGSQWLWRELGAIDRRLKQGSQAILLPCPSELERIAFHAGLHTTVE